jgi:hypothetical protein
MRAGQILDLAEKWVESSGAPELSRVGGSPAPHGGVRNSSRQGF